MLIELYHYGVKGMKWGVRKVKTSARKIDLQSLASKAKFLSPITLSEKEYAHVMSEIATHITQRERSQPVIVKNIGKYKYMFVNHLDNTYDVVYKQAIPGAFTRRKK